MQASGKISKCQLRCLCVCSYLIWQLWVVSLSCGEDKDGAERGHVLQQGEEGALHSIAHCVPPLWDVWHVYHTGHASARLTENLRANWSSKCLNKGCGIQWIVYSLYILIPQ